MQTTIITEFVNIDVLPTTKVETLLAKADIINEFLQQQDGFIDAELVKTLEGNTWFFIYHIEDFENVKSVEEKIKAMKLFDELTPLIEPNSMYISIAG